MSKEWGVMFHTMDEMRILAESAEDAWVRAFHATDMMPTAVYVIQQAEAGTP